MAGDWIPVEHATPTKPEVLQIASILGIPPKHAFGCCVTIWLWFDQQTVDGRAFGVTPETLDALVNVENFSAAMQKSRWLNVTDEYVEIPKHKDKIGKTAKKRAKDRLRQQRYRSHSVTHSVTKKERDKRDHTEQNRTEQEQEEIHSPKSPPGTSSERSGSDADDQKPSRAFVTQAALETAKLGKFQTPECRESLTLWAMHFETVRHRPMSILEVEQNCFAKAQAGWTPERLCRAIADSIAAGWKGINENTQRAVAAETGRRMTALEKHLSMPMEEE